MSSGSLPLRPSGQIEGKRIALVLGGGGLKGFAHIGVLRALEERGIVPALIAGTSIGSLIGAAYACGTTVEELTERALALKKTDLFQLNRIRMLLDRLRATAIYSDEPLRACVESVVPPCTFGETKIPFIANTVDIEHGIAAVWGTSGMRDVLVRDAVYASCALPGAFPPGHVGGRLCADGGTMDNLPVAIAARDMDAVIAIDVGTNDLAREQDISQRGFFDIYMRAAQIMFHALQGQHLSHWGGPPLLLVRPKVNHIPWFSFGHTAQFIEQGYQAATEALSHLDVVLSSRPGQIFPRHAVEVEVLEDKCTGCGLCVSLSSGLMRLDDRGKAFPIDRVVHWSPVDGDFVRQCPTNAITAERVERRVSLPVIPIVEEAVAAQASEATAA